MPPAPHRRRRRVLYGAAATILTTALLTVLPQTAAQAVDPLISQNRPAPASSVENAGAHRRMPPTTATHQPLGQPVQRSAVARDRPGRHRHDQPGQAVLGGGLRQGVPDPDVHRQRDVDDDLLDDDRHRRHPDAGRDRFRALRADVWHGPWHPDMATRSTSSRSTGWCPTNPARATCSPTRRSPAQTPSQYTPPNAYFHEFQANCSANHALPDDPIVFPGQPGASHMHTFMGNTTTNAATTTVASFERRRHDLPGAGRQVGLLDADDVQRQHPDPARSVRRSSTTRPASSTTPASGRSRRACGSSSAARRRPRRSSSNLPGTVEGWECGDSYFNWDFPANCPAGTQLNIRLQSPSCWNGLYLDTPDHKSHMAYPVNGRLPGRPPDRAADDRVQDGVPGQRRPVPAAAVERTWLTRSTTTSSTRGTRPRCRPMVTHCINGGLQCDARGYDQNQPAKGAVLDQNYHLIH